MADLRCRSQVTVTSGQLKDGSTRLRRRVEPLYKEWKEDIDTGLEAFHQFPQPVHRLDDPPRIDRVAADDDIGQAAVHAKRL